MNARQVFLALGVVAALSASASFAHRSELTVSGYAGAETLTGFPLPVRISEARIPGFRYADCRADALDLQFTSPDGEAVYPHEVERWVPGGESLVWVRIPALSGQDTKFVLHFGDASCETAANAKDVWSGAMPGAYSCVWHFGEETADGYATAADSAKRFTEYSMDAVPVAAVVGGMSYKSEMTSMDGMLGLGRNSHQGGGSNVSYFKVEDFPSAGISDDGVFTVSGWVRITNFVAYRNLIGQSESQWDGGSAWMLSNYANVSQVKVSTSSANSNYAMPDLSAEWAHLTVVYNGTEVSVYTNGSLQTQAIFTSAAANNSKPLVIGAQSNGGNPVCGQFDEWRILSGVPSADWVAAEYASAADDAFVTAGAVVPDGTDTLTVTATPGEYVGGGLPVYGQIRDLADGEKRVLTAPSAPFAAADGLTASVTGWTLYEIAADGAETPIAADTGSTCTYVHVGGRNRRLVWEFALTSEFLYEAELTVGGYTGSTTLRGFPVLVRISPATVSGFAYSLCKGDGSDIQFLSPDGATVYPHEVERWSPDGTSFVWVRVPELSGTETKMLFRFGCATLEATAEAKATWAKSAGGYYAGVWHFGETIAAEDAATAVSADSAQHSAALDLDGHPANTQSLAANMKQMTSADGKIGLARVNSVDKENNYLSIPSYDEFAFGARFTFSGWFKVTTLQGNYARLFGRSFTQWGGDGAWCGQYYNGATKFKLYVNTEAGETFNAPDATAGEWIHYAVVFNGHVAEVFANGQSIGVVNREVIAGDNGKALVLGSSMGQWKFYGLYDEVRLLSEPVSADWIKAEYDTANDAAFLTAGAAHLIANDSFFITSSTEQLGTVTPAYGTYSGALAQGTRIPCFAQTEEIVVSDVMHAAIRGWKLYEYDEDGEKPELPYDEAETNALVYVHESGKSRELEWQVVRLRPVVLSANRGATYLINGETATAGTNWVEEGTATLKVEATDGEAGADWVFNGWRIDGEIAYPGQEVTIPVTGPIELLADFSSLIHVAKGGDDGAPGTESAPLATISAAIAKAGRGDEIHVAGGTYAENLRMESKAGIVLRGGYDETDWTRDLAGHQTVVKPASGVGLTMNASVSNVISGLAFTGCTRGIAIARVDGNRFEQLIVTNNTQSGIHFYAAAGDANARRDFVVASSLIADNGGYGISQENTNWGSQGRCLVLLNSTVTRNASGGLYLQLANGLVVNSIVSGNAGTDVPKDMTYAHYAQTELRNSLVGTVSFRTNEYNQIHNQLRFRAGVLRGNPRFAEDGCALSAASRCIARGEDLSSGEYPVTDDVFGMAWNGVYDLGCFKSDSPKIKPTAYAETWVSKSGDDDNEGDDPARAVATVAEGVLRTAPGGVCHVGEGVFEEPVSLGAEGIQLIGAGRDLTVLSLPDGSLGANLTVSAHDIEIRDLGIRNGLIGVYSANDGVASNTLVRACLFADNGFGFVKGAESATAPAAFVHDRSFWLDRVRMGGYAQCGVLTVNMLRDFAVTSSLFDGGGRGAYGIHTLSTRLCAYNDTILDHTVCGLFGHATWGNAADNKCYNVIFAGNAIGWKYENDTQVHGQNCLFDNVIDTDFPANVTYTPADPGFVFADAKLSSDPNRRGRPVDGSPAIDGGVAVPSLNPYVPVTADLDGIAYRPRHWDIGCYARQTGLLLLVR